MGDLAVGLRYLGRGQRWIGGHLRWFGFGLLPALLAFALYAAALTGLAFWADDFAAWATPFADDWGSPWRSVLRNVFAVLLWLSALLLAVLTFTAVTLLIGDPFYEKLSEEVEESEGGCPPGVDRPLWRELWQSLCDSVYVLYRALLFTVPLFFLGFVPVVGQTVIPVLGICVSGFFLTLELTSVAMQRRDVPVRERLRLLRGRRTLAVAFGAPLALAFLLPFVAVLLMPGAVAGAALLVRDVLEERLPTGPPPGTPYGTPDAYGPPGPGTPGPYGTPGPDAYSSGPGAP
ncbi:EI24 domain-containing protein [Streptomyces sp. Z26]|uniref:EI24 domain-containing protein n=1 Tax=Streptomyces sp. Z26 TaxID=2500177 RepID=UPI000EF169F4|nr:EI24 domain-containing protein [Streptomyces sp. Z26]RLL66233.1 hypothetical protein D7M15_04270 [Streptomyces sp. Z26]